MKPPIVLLHALGTTPRMWREPQQALTRYGHPVVTPRFPVPQGEPSLDRAADELARTLPWPGAIVVGSSMGGYLAMAFLRRHPRRVLGIGLLSARATADPPAVAQERERFADAVVRDPSIVQSIVPKLVSPNASGSVITRVREMAAECDPHALAWCQRAIAARPDSLAVLEKADVPGAVLVGDQDQLVEVGEMREVAEVMRAGLTVVPEAGHLPPVEAPKAVTRLLIGLADAC